MEVTITWPGGSKTVQLARIQPPRPTDRTALALTARWGLLALMLPYVTWLVFAYEYHFLDGANLLLHEGGHVLFSLFGDTAQALGGTFGQLLFPIAFVAYFAHRGQRFEAFVVGVWLSESVMNVARYLGDAKIQALPLVGGHIHDWNWLLTRWGRLDDAAGLGRDVHVLGSFLAVGFLGLAAGTLRNARNTSGSATPAPLGTGTIQRVETHRTHLEP
jgi:hypothetical protein